MSPSADGFAISGNSWYFRTGFTHRYYCSCGEEGTVENWISERHHPDYRCRRCGNRRFLDAVALREDSTIIYWSPFSWDYSCRLRENGWECEAVMLMPFFDYRRQKVSHLPFSLATFFLSRDGEHYFRFEDDIVPKRKIIDGDESAYLVGDRIRREIVERVEEHISLHSPAEIAWLFHDESYRKLKGRNRLHAIGFFLRHPHLGESDFLFWRRFELFADISKEYPTTIGMLEYLLEHRREKSLRRSLFASYRRSMETLGFYEPVADFVFSRAIANTDLLRELLGIEPAVKSEIFHDIAPDEALELFDWLSRHYEPSSQTRLFLSLQDSSANRDYLHDIFRMLRTPGISELTREHFRRVPANWRSIHDELVSLHHLHRLSTKGNRHFLYRDKDRETEGSYEGLSYRLPEGVPQLHHWAKELGNCMFSYATAIHDGESIIFAIFKEDILSYAIEIRRQEIVQAKAKFNQSIPPDDMKKIRRWFKTVYQKIWMQAA